jgi:hypothetical protein
MTRKSEPSPERVPSTEPMPDLSGWRNLPERLEALPGQLDLFSVGVRAAEMPRAERKERAAGQKFLFDDQD